MRIALAFSVCAACVTSLSCNLTATPPNEQVVPEACEFAAGDGLFALDATWSYVEGLKDRGETYGFATTVAAVACDGVRDEQCFCLFAIVDEVYGR